MVDQPVVVRKKHPDRVAQPGQGAFRNQQTVLARVRNKAGLKRGWERHPPSDSSKERRSGGIGGDRPCGDGQAQRQLRAAGYADVGTGEPGRLGREHGSATHDEFFWGYNRNKEIDRFGVAVIADSPLHKALGYWPGDAAGREPRRQVPFDRRRQTGITGVAPIDVPPGLDREVKVNPEGGSRSNRCRLRDERGRDEILWVRGAVPPRWRRHGDRDYQGYCWSDPKGRGDSHPCSAAMRLAVTL